MTWEEFASLVRTYQVGFMGEPNEVKPGKGEFHENPSSCICQNSEDDKMNNKHSDVDMTEELFSEEEKDWPNVDFLDSRTQNQFQRHIRTDSVPSVLVKPDQHGLEEFFSD